MCQVSVGGSDSVEDSSHIICHFARSEGCQEALSQGIGLHVQLYTCAIT